MSKLSLDRDKIDQSKKVAEQIVGPVCHYVDRHTTVSIERCVLRLLGVQGPLEENPKEKLPQGRYPLVNAVIDKIGLEDLERGAGYWFGLAAVHNPGLDPTTLARKIATDEINLGDLNRVPRQELDRACKKMLSKQIDKLRRAREHRSRRPSSRQSNKPLRYVIVATGNIHEDILQAQAAAEMGADIIAVIRSTAQSLLDYVPEGETTEGFGGTYATQENFRLMREALDQTEKKIRRRVGLTNYSSGLCMPEIAVLGALEGVDYLLNDAMYGILFRDINMRRNFVDQHFSRRICALSGITIQTGEDNYLTTAESFKYWYQVLTSHFINQAFAKRAGLSDHHLALGHAFEMDPWIEDSMLYEWSQAQLVREIFPRCPIKFMPPTKHKSGDIFFSYLYDGMFNLAGVLTGQTIQLLGMHTEAIHNPHIQDRFLSLKNANYVFNAAKSAQDEIIFQPHGKIGRRARQVLDDSFRLLNKVKFRGMFRAIEEGAFANIRRRESGGKGAEGVVHKSRDYYTPLQEYLVPRGGREEESRSRYSTRGGRRRPAPPPAKRRAGRTPTRDSRARTGTRDQKSYNRRDSKKQGGRGRYSDRGRNPRKKEEERAAPKKQSDVILLPPPAESKPAGQAPVSSPVPESSQASPLPKDTGRRPPKSEKKSYPRRSLKKGPPSGEDKKSTLPRRPLKREEAKGDRESAIPGTSVRKPEPSVEAKSESPPPSRRPLTAAVPDPKPTETRAPEKDKPVSSEKIPRRPLPRRPLKTDENKSSNAPGGEDKVGPSKE